MDDRRQRLRRDLRRSGRAAARREPREQETWMSEQLEKTLEGVRSLKASAKSARDDGDWVDAVAVLHEAIAWLRDVRGSVALGFEERLDAELADTYGQIGGIERRWGLGSTGEDRRDHLRRSQDAYDCGFALEQNLETREASIYNRINRLVGRVLLHPEVLENAPVDDVDVLAELGVAEVILDDHIAGPRRQDPWAFCDVGTIRLLRGTDYQPVVRALERLQPPRFVYESWLSTLRPLSEVASTIRPGLLDVVRQVERAARYGN
jgi:hypothetical protein